jgi:hypothetical protein
MAAASGAKDMLLRSNDDVVLGEDTFAEMSGALVAPAVIGNGASQIIAQRVGQSF